MVNRIRYPLLAFSLLLLVAMWAGLVRLGWRWPALLPALPISHGPLMVSGFLGFVFSMLFAHAPIIFPAVLGNPVVYSPFFYVFLILLQVSLAGRLIADLGGFWELRLWTGLLNAIALTLFIATMMLMVVKGRRIEQTSSV